MLIELVHGADCDCGEHADATLQDALRKLDIREAIIRRAVVRDSADAERIGMTACPTLRVNGLDAQLRYRWDRNYRAICRTQEGAAKLEVADVIKTIKKTTCTRFGCC